MSKFLPDPFAQGVKSARMGYATAVLADLSSNFTATPFVYSTYELFTFASGSFNASGTAALASVTSGALSFTATPQLEVLTDATLSDRVFAASGVAALLSGSAYVFSGTLTVSVSGQVIAL